MPRSLETTIRIFPRTYAFTSRSIPRSNFRFTSTTSTPNPPSTATMAPIERITLFKIPKEEDRQRLLEQYKVLAKTATKVRQQTALNIE